MTSMGLMEVPGADWRPADPWKMAPSVQERIAQRAIPGGGPNGDCLVYPSKRRPYVNFRGAHIPLTRALWIEVHGPLAPGQQIRHVVCANAWCVRLDHLTTGTHNDNMDDYYKAPDFDINVHLTGAKLTEDDVRAIRVDPRKQRDIAADYGVSQSQISVVKRRITWAHVL